jgi:hypothetical protein
MMQFGRSLAGRGIAGPWAKRLSMIEASRTLMKSEPELAELIQAVEGVEVTMAEKGFGTRVEVRADEDTGLEESDLEAFLDRLAEPHRRPFSGA